MYFLYRFLLLTAIALTLPLWVWRYVTTPKYRGTLRQRLGLDLPVFGPGPRIWVHAVSVGEALAAQGLLGRLAERYPNHQLVLSTVTKTGQQVARQTATGNRIGLYLPLDLPWPVQRVVAAVDAEFFIVMETELWPELFHALARRGTPIIVANGRLSPNSSRNYRRVRRAMARFLEPVHLFAMQSEMDAQRMRDIGARPERVRCTGNLKYDQALRRPTADGLAELERTAARPDGPVWIAASTHPGEEEVVLTVFARLRERLPDLRLILAPRHPERCDRIAAALTARHLDFARISAAPGVWPQPVLLVDRVGWLTRLYSHAQVAFVGGSLIPHGGQNMLEPAAWGVPPLFGPHTFNFREASRQLLESDAAVRVTGVDDLYNAVHGLLADPDRRRAMGRRGTAVVQSHAGALDRTMAAIAETLAVSEPVGGRPGDHEKEGIDAP